MRYQDRIYNQNTNNVRNHTIALPNTSSDICTFDIPLFTMTGGSKIDCIELTCDLSGVSYNNVLTATTDCFISNELSGTCFNNIEWSTNIYEDSELVYSNIFYTSSNIGDAATESSFTGSVVTAFDSLGYDYSINGTQYTLNQKDFKNFNLSIVTEINYDNNCPVTGNTTSETFCSCPVGYNPTPADDSCVFTTSTAATLNGVIYTATTGNKNTGYCVNGTGFYSTNLTTEPPYILTGTSATLRNSDGSPITFNAVVTNPNTLWDSNGSILYGRLNNCGIWTTEPDSGGNAQPNLEWVGFSSCIDIMSGGTYSIGLSADNWARFKLDGEMFFTSESAAGGTETLSYWRVFEVQLTSGKHIIEMEGKNNGSNASFGAEIYNVGISNLTGMTTESQLSAVTIFTTADFRSDVVSGTTGIQVLDLGESSGYSCPAGYSLDVCGTGYTCTQLNYTDTVCVFTGTCSGDTEIVCDLDFNGLTSGDTNVHVITGQTTIPLDFTFTANTNSLTGNTTFKFDIYKFNKNVGYFFSNPSYRSEEFNWSDFSGTSAFTTTVPVSSLDLDGDYLVKGYYIHDVCTQFANLNGDRKVSPPIKSGTEYLMYQPYKDFHFVSFTKAETPLLGEVDSGDREIGSLIVNSLILDGTTNQYDVPLANSGYIVSLNGLTLSQGEDYSIQTVAPTTGTSEVAAVLTLSGDTYPDDVLTYALVNNQEKNGIRFDGYSIDSPITSGVTDNQGSETVYFNTTTGRYEFYTTYTVVPGNDVIVTLNGITLANNIDYYLSTSNPKRIIFQGGLALGDIINVFYNSNGSLVGDVFTTSFGVNWSIVIPPQTTYGLFSVEISDSDNFGTILSSTDVDYTINQVGYSATIPLSGSAGDTQYYRVKNKKRYIDLCGNPIITTAYSEVNEITIQTNAYNSY